MGEILGAGMSHYPGFVGPIKAMAGQFQRALKNGRAPKAWEDPSTWPAAMREEYGADAGASAAVRHRQKVVGAFLKVRNAIDAFRPDLVLIFGDDQWENLHDDMVPPFAVYAFDELEVQPFARRGAAAFMEDRPGTEGRGAPEGRGRGEAGGPPAEGLFGGRENYWGDPPDKTYKLKGHRQAGVYLVNSLMDQGFDIAYSYRPLHAHGLGHAHMNTLLFLDDDRRGWPHPTIPFHINCHGDLFVRNHAHGGPVNEEMPPDPKGPSPRRCFEVGQAIARALKASPWRCVIIGSASWSHGSLSANHYWVYPNLDADRRLYEHLKANDLTHFRDLTNEELAATGQREVLDWCAVIGAMHELGQKAEIVDFTESWIFNSSKCTTLFRPR